MKINKRVTWMYVFFVLLYGVVVSLFTSTVHINNDEELYINLARSFHYEGSFMVEGELVNYSCVLYSLIISLAYYVYTPETNLFVMRLMNVLIMCSAIFPTYCLAEQVLEDEKKACKLAAFTMILPYMFDSAYIMQEVLAYPLFLWAVCFLYHIFEEKKENTTKKSDYILAAFFSAACFFTKTYLLAIPVIVNLIVLLYWILEKKEERRKLFYRTVKFDIWYIVFFGVMYLGVLGINGFERGNSHYDSMFAGLFPITLADIYWAFLGIVVYIALTIVNIGILPLETIWTIRFQKKNIKKKMWLEDFVLFGLVFVIVEVILLTFAGEQGAGNLPYRFSFRFFHIFVPMAFILFVKYYEELIHKKVISRLVSVLAIVVCICYFFYVNNILGVTSKQAILDGHLFLLIENITKLILPFADIIIMCLLIIALSIETFWKKKQKKYPMKLIVTCFVVLWLVNCVQLPVYNNIIAGGKEIQEDSIKIAECLNENNIEFVYYVETDREGKAIYLRNFYGYLTQPYKVLDLYEELDGIESHGRAVIVQKDEEKEISEVLYQKVDLGMDKFALYISVNE